MNQFVIQVFRCGEWRNVSTFSFEGGKNAIDGEQKNRRAYRAAMIGLTRWSGYFSEPMRIAEPVGYREYREARV